MDGKKSLRRKGVILFHLSLLLFTFILGCYTPYFNKDSWYERLNARPKYFANYDVFYLFPDRYDGGMISISNRDWTVAHVSDMFGIKVRVFAPLCRDIVDARKALDWYLDKYNEGGYPYVMIAEEGFGEKTLRELADDYESDYLVACHWGPLTTNTVLEIKKEMQKWNFVREWGTREVE